MIGISLGSLNTCVGVLKNNNVDIILSETSSRSIPTLVSFAERERKWGDQANFIIKSNFANTINYPTRLLGHKADWPFLQEEAKYALNQPLIDENGEIYFELKYKGETEKFTPEAVVGIYFDKLKQNWKKSGYETKDIVVSCPDYMTAHERNALLEAIKIADLNCVSLVNESSAIAVAYGLFRRMSFDKETPKIVAFVDMGETKASVFFGSFSQGVQKVISVSTERFCGARDIDYLLMQHYAEKFKTKYGCDPMKNTKVKLRMLETIAKARKILTGNTETNITIDSLMEDEDLNYMITRQEFETIASGVIEKYRNLMVRALAEAKLKPSDVSSVEMVGDAVRIPILQQIIKEVFGVDVSKTLSPDEVVARGATLHAAMNSPYFNLKDYVFEHCNPCSIIFEYPFLKNDKVEIRNTKLIQKNEVYPSRKSIKFTEKQIPKDNVLEMKFYYSQEELPFLKNNFLKNYMVSIPKVKEEQYTLAMEFYLDNNSLFILDKAFIIEVYYEDKVIPVKPETTTTTPTTTTPPTEGTNTSTQTTTETKPEEKKEPEKVKKERRTNCTIQLVTCVYGRNPTQMTQMIQREATQENDDKNLKYVIDKRNEIETFIYSTREKLSGSELKLYADNTEIENLLAVMNVVENWLYSNPEDTYIKAKIEEAATQVFGPGQKIYKRKDDHEKLTQSLTLLKETVNKNITKFDQQFSLSKENKALLIKSEMEEVQKHIQSYNEGYNKALEVAVKAPKFIDVSIKYEDIIKQSKEFDEKISKVFNDAEKRVKEAERKLKEELKKIEDEKKEKERKDKEAAAAEATANGNKDTTKPDEKMQLD